MKNVLFSKRKPDYYKKIKAIKNSPENQNRINDLLCLHNTNGSIKTQESLTLRKYLTKLKERGLSETPFTHTSRNDNTNKNKSKITLDNHTTRQATSTPKTKKNSVHLKCIDSIIHLPYDTKINYSCMKKNKSQNKAKINKSPLFSNEKILFSIRNSEKENASVRRLVLYSNSVRNIELMINSTVKQSLMSNLSLGNIRHNSKGKGKVKSKEKGKDQDKDKEEEDMNRIGNGNSPLFYLNRDQSDTNIITNMFKSRYYNKEKEKKKIHNHNNTLLTQRINKNKSLVNNYELIFKKLYFPKINKNSKEISAKTEQIHKVLNKISNHFHVLKDEIV